MGTFKPFKYINKYAQQPYKILLISLHFINDYTETERGEAWSGLQTVQS